MSSIIHERKQKFFIVGLAVFICFVGFQTLSVLLGEYQIESFFVMSLIFYAFMIFLQSFVFDLHLKVTSLKSVKQSLQMSITRRFAYMFKSHHFLHFRNYLILPGIIYWSGVLLLYLNPFDETLKQIVIIICIPTIAMAYWYMKTIFYRHHESDKITRHLIFLVKLVASYLAFASILGIGKHFGYEGLWYALGVFCVTFLLLYQALFQHHFVQLSSLKLLVTAGLTLGILGYGIYYLWNVNFYTGALVLTAVYNTIWGYIHHKFIDQDLTRDILYEYLAILFVILVILIGSTNFAERI